MHRLETCSGRRQEHGKKAQRAGVTRPACSATCGQGRDARVLTRGGAQAIDLQRVLDGEKAQRTDVTRRLTELGKQAARLQRLDPPDEVAAAEVHRERTALEQRKLQHSAQVHA